MNTIPKDQGAEERAAETWILFNDRQASIMGLLSGEARRDVAYTVYGYCRSVAAQTPLCGFSDYFIDAVTARYVLGNGYRFFSPELMRFVSPDRLSPFARGGINAYAYCEGNPVGRIDPDGRAWADALTYKPLRIKLKGAKALEANMIAQPGSGEWRTKWSAAKLNNEFKSEFDSLPSVTLGQVDFQEIKALVSYRSLKNARREFIRAAKTQTDIKPVGILPLHLQQLKASYNQFRSVWSAIPLLGRGVGMLSSAQIEVVESRVRDHFNSNVNRSDDLIKNFRQERDELAIQLGRP